jgi:hypothetical protein
MSQVGRLAEFPRGSLVRQFAAKTYEKAIEEAKKVGGFLFYFEQEFGRNSPRQTKTILVCYKEN